LKNKKGILSINKPHSCHIDNPGFEKGCKKCKYILKCMTHPNWQHEELTKMFEEFARVTQKSTVTIDHAAKYTKALTEAFGLKLDKKLWNNMKNVSVAGTRAKIKAVKDVKKG